MAEQSTNTGTFLAGLLTAAVLGLPTHPWLQSS